MRMDETETLASAPGPLGGLELGELWLDKNDYALSRLAVDARRHLPRHLHPVSEHFGKLSLLANAARDLESVPSWREGEWLKRALVAQCLPLLEDIAARIEAPRDRYAISQRIRLLRGETTLSSPDVIQALHGFSEEELFLFCGPLKTWSAKSDRRFFSFLCGVPDAALNTFLRQMDEDSALAFMRGLLGDSRIELQAPPHIVFLDLIASGGEANRYPKNFAHFFPEDEQSVLRRSSRTVVFTNLYVHRFLASSRALLERFTRRSPAVTFEEGSLRRVLSVWMRGHDLGHFLQYASRDLARLDEALGVFESGVLQEAVADCTGYLLLSSERIRALLGLSEEAVATVFLGELLRYLVRGGRRFTDSDAAFLELVFLLRHEAVWLEGGQLRLRPWAFRRALMGCLQTLVRPVMATDVPAAVEWSSQHLAPDSIEVIQARQFTERLMNHSHDVPDCTSYSFVY